MAYNIKKLGKLKLLEVIETRQPLGLFYQNNLDGTYTAVDNEAGEVWTEDFKSLRDTKDWLYGTRSLEEIRETENK